MDGVPGMNAATQESGLAGKTQLPFGPQDVAALGMPNLENLDLASINEKLQAAGLAPLTVDSDAYQAVLNEQNSDDSLAQTDESDIMGEQDENGGGLDGTGDPDRQTIEGAESSLSSKIYTPVEYKGTVKINGEVKDVSRRVYQRNDIDIDYLDETTGLTNLERMQAGKPPIGSDGNPIELHHVLQQEVGPMAELREITHQAFYSQLHGLIENGASFRNNPLLNKQYNNFRYNYWKWRASLITGGN